MAQMFIRFKGKNNVRTISKCKKKSGKQDFGLDNISYTQGQYRFQSAGTISGPAFTEMVGYYNINANFYNANFGLKITKDGTITGNYASRVSSIDYDNGRINLTGGDTVNTYWNIIWVLK